MYTYYDNRCTLPEDILEVIKMKKSILRVMAISLAMILMLATIASLKCLKKKQIFTQLIIQTFQLLAFQKTE